jgi:predicted RNA-binding protein
LEVILPTQIEKKSSDANQKILDDSLRIGVDKEAWDFLEKEKTLFSEIKNIDFAHNK